MRSHIAHLQYNVRPDNLPYYRDLFGQLGWQTLHDADGFLGLGGDGPASIWFAGLANEHVNDYDGPGHNHLGIGVPSQADVDAMATWLTARGTALLFDTPRPSSRSPPTATFFRGAAPRRPTPTRSTPARPTLARWPSSGTT